MWGLGRWLTFIICVNLSLIVPLILALVMINNSPTSFCLRSSSCRTDFSIHFQPSRPTTIWMFFFSYPYDVYSTFYYETDHSKCKLTLDGSHCGQRLFRLGRPLHTGFEPRSPAWLACSTGQSATTYTTVEENKLFISKAKYDILSVLFCFCFCVIFWTVVAVQRPSRWLHRSRLFSPT